MENRGRIEGRVSTATPRSVRFAFGRNWSRFLADISEPRIAAAQASLLEMLDCSDLEGRRFLDVGSGSGLFSLAARRSGAHVHSFDVDSDSVACTSELRRRYFADDEHWLVESGSILDPDYVAQLAPADIVYSWGVLHHTGQMWTAIARVTELVAPGGQLYLAIYNDQGRFSRRWARIKRLYNRLPAALRWCVLLPAFVRLWGPTLLSDLLRGKPLQTWRSYAAASRGMSAWRDVVDWVGGYPFEVARPEEVFAFCRQRGFQLEQLKTCAGGIGCNEFVFRRTS